MRVFLLGVRFAENDRPHRRTSPAQRVDALDPDHFHGTGSLAGTRLVFRPF
jgi:hypothetical protein